MSARRVSRAAALLALAMSASAFAVVPAATAVATPVQAPTPSVECGTDHDSDARMRPDQHGHERNVLSAKEVAAAEREFQSRLATSGLTVQAQVTVPVVFHVVTSTSGQGNVTDSQINQQIAEMNQNFAGQEAPGTASNTQFSFTLQQVRRWANNAWFNDPDSASGEAAMKNATRQGDRRTLNIWSTNTSFLGYATFPSSFSSQPKLDGVVIQFGSVPGGSIPDFNLGKTASHETGHWLGLFHTFQGGCSTTNDQVADTPAQRSPTSGCPTGRNSCPSAGVDPIHNYMDYSVDSCYNQFTPGQTTRMQNQWAAFRA